MRVWTTIVSLALLVGCVTDDAQKKKKKKDDQTSFPEDVITPQDAADFTDSGASFVPKQKFSGAQSNEDFTLDGSGHFETWDAAASDEDLAASTEDDVEEQDPTVHEPVIEANPLTDMVTVKSKEAPVAPDATDTKVHVLYVKRTQVPVRRNPDDKANVSRTLDQGDTVVGTVEGEWARLNEGEWVHMKDLSWNPVGRSRTGRR